MRRSLQTFSMFARALLLPGLTFVSLTSSVAAEDATITIELNKAEQTDQGCRSLFLFDNRSGHQLNAFQIELVLFDDKGIHARNILLDMAPLYKDKKVIASFVVADLACEEIGSILVNTLPSCANSTGTELDCLAWLDVSSKSAIPLEK